MKTSIKQTTQNKTETLKHKSNKTNTSKINGQTNKQANTQHKQTITNNRKHETLTNILNK